MKFPDADGPMDGKNYLKLKDKESVRGVFRGNPYLFRTHWVDKKSSVCTGAETCVSCQKNVKSTFRFRVNFIVKENETYTPKIWEQGWTVYTQLKNLNETDYDLEKTIVRVTRTGSGMNDTTYTVLPLPNGVVDQALDQKLTALKLHELNVFQSPNEKTHPTEEAQDAPFNEDDIGF